MYQAMTGLSDKHETWRIEAGTLLSDEEVERIRPSLTWLLEQGLVRELDTELEEEPDGEVQ